MTIPRPEIATTIILITGGLPVDDIAISAENLKAGSSNAVSWHHRPGGVAANIARVAAQQLDVMLIANTGDDEQGKMLEKIACSTLASHYWRGP